MLIKAKYLGETTRQLVLIEKSYSKFLPISSLEGAMITCNPSFIIYYS